MKSLYSLSDGFCHRNAVQNNLSPQDLCDGIRGQGQQNLSLTSAKIIHSFILFNKVACLSQWEAATVSHHLSASLTTGAVLLADGPCFEFCLNYKKNGF